MDLLATHINCCLTAFLTLSTPVTQINCCLNVFLSYLFSIESVPVRLQHLHMYVSRLLREIRNTKADTAETILRKVMMCEGIVNLISIIKTTTEEVESRSIQYAGVTGIAFPYGCSSHGNGKDFEVGVGSYQQGIDLNHFMGQEKMSVENGGGPGGNLFQHGTSTGNHIWQRGGKYALGELTFPLSLNGNQQNQMPSTSINLNLGQLLGEELENVAGGSGMMLSPMGNYPQVKPNIININLVAPAGTNINHVNLVHNATSDNYAQGADRPKPRRPQRLFWTNDLKAKFQNAVERLGGSKLTTASRIWRMMGDETLTVRQVDSYLQVSNQSPSNSLSQGLTYNLQIH